MARREAREYREYLSAEQRSQPGCPARELWREPLGRDTRVSRSYRCQVALAIVLEHVVFAGHVKHRHRQVRQHLLQRIELGRPGQLALGNNRGVIRVFGNDDASARI
jgi:hypothetical protein